MFWLLNVYSPHWPLSGSVAQDIHPSLLAQAGDRGVEREVLSDVASYGRQIGKLSELLLKVAKALPPDKLVERVDAIKTRYKRLKP